MEVLILDFTYVYQYVRRFFTVDPNVFFCFSKTEKCFSLLRWNNFNWETICVQIFLCASKSFCVHNMYTRHKCAHNFSNPVQGKPFYLLGTKYWTLNDGHFYQPIQQRRFFMCKKCCFSHLLFGSVHIPQLGTPFEYPVLSIDPELND